MKVEGGGHYLRAVNDGAGTVSYGLQSWQKMVIAQYSVVALKLQPPIP